MAENQKYYYLKLKDDFFDDEKIILLESIPDGYLYCNILLKLYLRSLKFRGKLMFSERIPYDVNMLATLTRHQVGTVQKALDAFRTLELIEIIDNGAIYMMDIQSYIGTSSTEGDRKREQRERIKQEKEQEKHAIEDTQKRIKTLFSEKYASNNSRSNIRTFVRENTENDGQS